MESAASPVSTQCKRIILVAEDQEMVQHVCLNILRRYGFDYILAKDGAEALDIYCEKRDELALIVSDVAMPHMTGIELFRRVLAMDPHADVILMSGFSIEDLIPDDLKKLCSVLQKPFTSEVFISAIKKCLKYDDEHHAEATSS
jgi:two-component system cell cycle sensor histidine kinase/response regulator CckA